MAAVLIYSTATCPYCWRAKQLLKEKGVAFTDIRVDLQPQRRIEMIEKSGRKTVPQIWIGDMHVGGSDELATLEQRGLLDKLLQN